MNLSRLLLCALTLPLLALGGCPQPEPGIELGRYLVVATRTGGTCGPQQEEGAYSFQVDLTPPPGLVRRSQPAGSPTDGTLDHASRAFRLRMEQNHVPAPSTPRAAKLAAGVLGGACRRAPFPFPLAMRMQNARGFRPFLESRCLPLKGVGALGLDRNAIGHLDGRH